MVAESRDSENATSARTLRLSITGECNLQCFYCRWIGHSYDLLDGRDRRPDRSEKNLIQASDVSKLVRIVGELGVRNVLIEGGEPLLRKDAANFIKAAFAHKNIMTVRLVTNGTYLKAHADALRKMGLRKVDINFDSLNFRKYHTITRRDDLFRVLDGLDKIEKLNFPEIRLNIFLFKGINSDELVDFARLTKERRVHLRLMEYRPGLFSCDDPHRDRLFLSVVAAKHAIDNYERMDRIHDLTQALDVPTYQFHGAPGRISFLGETEIRAEMQSPRVVFTADGMLLNERVPSRSQLILDDLRRDAKETRLHRTIEKIMTLHAQADKPAPKTKKRSAPIPSRMRGRTASATMH